MRTRVLVKDALSLRSPSYGVQSEAVTSENKPEMPAFSVPSLDFPELTDTTVKKPVMPYFLQLSDMDITRKFNELNLREQFRLEQSQVNPQWALCNAPGNLILDRYFNVQPWARNRVKLNVPNGNNDYINASVVSLHHPGSKSTEKYEYIVMQGPKENTVSHTWRMVWEQVDSPAVIVMLTDFEEGGREKCYQYFPMDAESSPLVIDEPDEFGDGFKATVSFSAAEKTDQGDAIEVRKLIMRLESPVKGDSEKGEEDEVKVEEKVIWHLLYTCWPDFGVPEVAEVDSFLALMTLSRAKNAAPENPRIIHCSAGVGRSGTFIALEYLLAELEAGFMVYHGDRNVPTLKPKGSRPTFSRQALTPPPFGSPLMTPPGSSRKEINTATGSPAHQAAAATNEKDMVFETVDRLREQRKMMVQADAQFSYVYRVLKRRWEVKYNGADSKPSEPEICQIDRPSS